MGSYGDSFRADVKRSSSQSMPGMWRLCGEERFSKNQLLGVGPHTSECVATQIGLGVFYGKRVCSGCIPKNTVGGGGKNPQTTMCLLCELGDLSSVPGIHVEK